MNILLISALLSVIVVLISNTLGNFIQKNIGSHFMCVSEILGFSVLIGILFIFDYLMLVFNFSTETIFLIFLLIILSILVLTLKYFKWNFTFIESILITSIILILFILSMRYRLGEEMGDNTYLMNMVSMNSRTHLNTTVFDNGLYLGISINTPNKEYLTWYHFYSFITFQSQNAIKLLNIAYIPSSLIFVWTGNMLFYFFSSILSINLIKKYTIKSKLIILSILILCLYWGTVYYNLVLPHYGSNFVSLFVISLLLLFLSDEDLNLKSVITIIISIYGISSMGNVGLISSSYLVFAYTLYRIIVKDMTIFKWVPFLLFPIFHWIWILDEYVPTKWLIPFYIVLSMSSWTIYYFKPVRDFIYKYILFIGGIILISWYSLSIITSNNYFALFLDFFAPKGNFDRLQDFFSFVNVLDSLRNIAYYIAIISLFANFKTRKIGYMVLIIFLFFINPIVYPMLYPVLQWLYHRAYISIFNIFIIMSGSYSFIEFIKNKEWKGRYIIVFIWILLLIPSTYQQITGYFHRIYIPGPDFNVFYKMDNTQIDILEKLRQIVTIEEYENAKVISQIYGTTMYVPEVYHIYSNYSTRRYYDPSAEVSNYDPLFRIFYTPVFPGDDGPRFNAPYKDTCSLLIENRIDFIIYDKELSVYDDSSKNWIPLHWYARSCAEKTYENNRYIMYRFYWK